MKTIKPMLAQSSPIPFTRDGWVFEAKLDGIRCLSDGHTLQARSGSDITKRFPEILVNADAVVDGELVVEVNGVPLFNAIQQRETDNRVAIRVFSQKTPATYYVFDILEFRGQSCTRLPLLARKGMLRELVKDTERVRVLPHFTDGDRLYHDCVEMGFEGVMAKNIYTTYQPGKRSPAWQKIKPLKTEWFWACGFTQGRGSRTGFGAIILGQFIVGVGMVHLGSVGSGFSEKDLTDWSSRDPAPCPFVEEPKMPDLLYWIKPEPVQVSYFERTATSLRFPRLAKKGA